MVILEHTLIILLLLTSLLNAQPKGLGPVRWILRAGILLALLAPSVTLPLPWEWLAALLLPLLLWQTAQRTVNARWISHRKDVLVWLAIIFGVAGIIVFTAQQPFASALLFGLLVASMAWRAMEPENQSSSLGQFAPLALAFLLVEIAPVVESPGRYALALLGGAGTGALIGYLALQSATRLPGGVSRDLLGAGQVYLAYAAGLVAGVSGVTAALLSASVFIAGGIRRGLWEGGRVTASPLDSPLIFILAGITLAFFGWQTHIPLTPSVLLEIALGLALSAAVIWFGRLIDSPAFLGEKNVIGVVARVGYLLIPAVLLWPRGAVLGPIPLLLALAAATLTILATNYLLSPLLDFYTWLEETRVVIEPTASPEEAVLVRDVMDTKFLTVKPEMSVLTVARLFTEHSITHALVVDENNRLVGIITEADLFIKQNRIPRTHESFPALFQTPLSPEQLPHVYNRVAAAVTAADVMTRDVIWVVENQSLGQAILLMTQHGLKLLPVVDSDPSHGGNPVGVVTRARIIQIASEKG